MKHSTRIAAALIAIALLAGCKKSGNPGIPGGSGNPKPAYFFANTEWVGTCHTVSQQYDLPCYLRFNGDTTVSVYASFSWLFGGAIQWVDSTVGHITKIDTTNGG